MGRDKTKPPFNTSGSTVPQRRRFICTPDHRLFPFSGEGVTYYAEGAAPYWFEDTGWGSVISEGRAGTMNTRWSSPLEMALMGIPLPDPSLYK